MEPRDREPEATPLSASADGEEDDAALPETAALLGAVYGGAGTRVRAAARARHLASLRARAEELGRPAPAGVTELAPRSARRGRRSLAVAAAWAAALLLGAGAAGMAADSALPGDALYGIKQAAEHVHLVLPGSSETAVARRLALTDRRLDEAEGLASAGSGDAGERGEQLAATIAAALAELDAADAAAGDDAALRRRVAAATAVARTRLARLAAAPLPASAEATAAQGLEALTRRLEAGPVTGAATEGQPGMGAGGDAAGAPAPSEQQQLPGELPLPALPGLPDLPAELEAEDGAEAASDAETDEDGAGRPSEDADQEDGDDPLGRDGEDSPEVGSAREDEEAEDREHTSPQRRPDHDPATAPPIPREDEEDEGGDEEEDENPVPSGGEDDADDDSEGDEGEESAPQVTEDEAP